MFWVVYVLDEKSRSEFQGEAMGTTWRVVINQDFNSDEKEKLSNEIITLIEEIEAEASHWREDSTLSQFNRAPQSTVVELGPHLANLLEAANRLNSETKGALDITLFPLIKVWGFGPEGRHKNVPTKESIQAAIKNVGHEKINLSRSSNRKKTLSKTDNGIQIDLSSIGKGYALDRIGELLKKQNLSSWYLEFGGEIKTRGLNSEEQPWRVGLEEPIRDQVNQVRKIIELHNLSVATSGDYRNYFPKPGRENVVYSHILDPRTGKPVTHTISSVSVVHESALIADGLATALMVLGPDEGYQLATEKGWAATFVSRENEGFVERSTPLFKDLVLN